MNKLRQEYCKENGLNYIKPKNTEMKEYVIWLEKRIEALNIANVSQQRELLEWLSNEDYFNIPKDEISEILEDWKTYNSNCG